MTIGYKDLVLSPFRNDVVNYPQDAPELMTEFAFENNFEFPYLYDETQEVAKAYHAACTPDFFYMTARTN
jgi:peroxiredoxin